MQEPKGLDRLRDRFVGEWDLDVPLQMPDGSTMTGTGTATVREVAGRYGIQSDLTYTIGGESYEETDLWTYDREKGTVHMFGAGSDGSTHDHTGRWKDADTLELRWSDPGGAEETITASWEAADTLRIRSETRVGGKPGPVMDSVGRRRKG